MSRRKKKAEKKRLPSAKPSRKRKSVKSSAASKAKSSSPATKAKPATRVTTSKRIRRVIDPSMRGVKEKDAPNMSAPSQAALSMEAARKMKKVKIKKAEILYLSPKTKEPLKRARKGDEVLYAIRKPDGSMHVLHPDAQSPDEKLKRYLKRHVGDGAGAFTLFVERRRTVAKKGEIEMRKGWVVQRGKIMRYDKDGKLFGVKRTRLAMPTVKKAQQPVLYRGGQRRRPIRPGFFKRGRGEISQFLSPVVVPLNKTVELNLKGATIHDSIRALTVDTSLKRLKPWEEVFYEFIVIYRDDKGDLHTMPGAGSSFAGELSKRGEFYVGNARRTAKVAQALATSIRQAFSHNKMRFTSTAWLSQLEQSLTKEYRREEKSGDQEKAEAIFGQLQRVIHPAYRGGGAFGPHVSAYAPVFPENKKGMRLRAPHNDMVRVRATFTVHENMVKKAQWEENQKRKKKK